jgi:hypothetical protein
MMKASKIVIFVLLTLLISSFAFADLTTDNALYYSYDDADLTGDDPDDISGNGRDGTNNGATTGVAGKINQAFDFDGANDDVTVPSLFSGQTAFTFCTWSEADSISVDYTVWDYRGNGILTYMILNDGAVDNEIEVYVRDTNTGANRIETTAYTVTDNLHLCYTVDGTAKEMELFVNGASVTTESWTGSLTDLGQSNDKIGENSAGAENYGGILDETAIYYRVLSSTEISELYNSGDGKNPYAPESFEIQITAEDIFDSSSITTFNGTIDGDTYSTTNGTIVTTVLNNETSPIDIYLDATGYETFEELSYDPTSGNFNAQMISLPIQNFSLLTPENSITNQTLYNFTWEEAVSPSGKSVTYTVNVNYTSNGSLVLTDTTSNLYYENDFSTFNSDEYTVTIIATEASSGSTSLNSSTIIYDGINYLYFFNEQSGAPIPNADITIVDPLGGNNTVTTDSDGKVLFSSYDSGNLKTGTYYITFKDFVGFVSPVNFNFTRNVLPFNLSYNITTVNLYINLYYRTNNAVFNQSADIIVQGILNDTTSNGSVSIPDVTAIIGDYTFSVFADGFYAEEKIVTITGQEGLNVDFYLLELDNNNSGTVTIRTIDEFQRLVSGTEVNLLEYKPSTLSYVEVSECLTDSNGECKFLVETNTKTYKFSASKSIDGTTISATTDPQIFQDDVSGGETIVFSEETITITLSGLETYTLNPLINLIFNVTESFNETTNQSNIDVSFRTIDGSSETICVEYFSIEGGVESSLTGETFCVSGAGAEVTENAFFTLNRSKDYVAKVYVKDSVLLDSFRYYKITSFQQRLIDNATLPFVFLFLWLVIVGIGVVFKNIPLTGVSIIIGTWAIAYFFPTITVVSASVLQTLIGLLLIYNGRKKEDFN